MNRLRTNQGALVMMSVMGMIAPPLRRGAYRIDREGVPFSLPGTGGITYNVKLGDSAFGWAGDHVEPCVSTAAVSDMNRSDTRNQGYNMLACIGNSCQVVSGDAKGAKGMVTGTHGGIEHVIMDFPDQDIEKMCIEDKIMIKAYGQGLKLLDYPGITVYNVDPRLLDVMGLKDKGGRLVIPVTHTVPGKLMGSGLGSPDTATGDYDITTSDQDEISRLGLAQLRFGDLVALEDSDNRFGRSYRSGAISIGVVVHSDCLLAGHGPGVTTLFTAIDGSIDIVKDPHANIGEILKIGRFRA